MAKLAEILNDIAERQIVWVGNSADPKTIQDALKDAFEAGMQHQLNAIVKVIKKKGIQIPKEIE